MSSVRVSWRLREIKNIRGLSGNEFYFKFFRPRTFWRLFKANIREVHSSIIRANIRERPPVDRVAVRRIQHAVCIGRSVVDRINSNANVNI